MGRMGAIDAISRVHTIEEAADASKDRFHEPTMAAVH